MKQFSKESFDHAQLLISEGKIDIATPWGFQPVDGNNILGDPPDWNKYSLWHLGQEFGVPEDDKGFYSYPYGKGGKIFRSALLAIKQRSGQMGEGEIQKAADELLQLIDKDAETEPIVAEAHVIEGELPKWFQLAPYGDHHTPKGRFIMYDAEGENLVKEFAKYFGANDMPIDFQHSSDKPGMESIAGAWVDKIEFRGKEGLFAHVKYYTVKAADHIRAGEYRYISPIIYVHKETRRAVFLRNAAFTNEPAFRGMEPLVAEIGSDLPHLEVEKQEVEMEELLRLLGLEPGTDIDAVLEAVNALIKKAEGAETTVTENAPIVASIGQMLTAFAVTDVAKLVPMVMSAQVAAEGTPALKEEIVSLKAELVTMSGAQVDVLVAEAIEAGKLLPSQSAWATKLGRENRASLVAFIAEAIPVIPGASDEAIEAARKKAASARPGGVEPSESDKMVMESLGLTQETVDEFGPKQ